MRLLRIGQTDVRVLAERLLAPMVDADVDALLLGCTHYPFLARVIRKVVGPDVILVSSAEETAFVVAGEKAGSKLAKAKQLGIEIVDELNVAYVAHASADDISIVDLQEHKVIGTMAAGREPDGMGYSSIATN